MNEAQQDSKSVCVPGSDFYTLDPSDSLAAEVNVIENPNEERHWYNRFFKNNPHENYIGSHLKFGGAVCVSILRENVGPQYRVCVWRASNALKRCVPADPDKFATFSEVLKAIDPVLHKNSSAFHKVEDPKLIKELADLEVAEPLWRMKLGVLYAKEGQVDEQEILGNREEDHSGAFSAFLGMLGPRVPLKGYTGYTAQLDVTNNHDGEYMIMRQFRGYNIVFQVSTLLHFDERDAQQVQRKRHIGNDICVIVFVDGSSPYSAEVMRTQYTNVIGVVQCRPDEDVYRIEFMAKKGVPVFGPDGRARLPRDESAIDYLITKCINGVSATCRSSEFTIRAQRTLSTYLSLFHDKYYPNAKRDDRLSAVLASGDMAKCSSRVPQVFTVEVITERFSPPTRVTCFDSWRASEFSDLSLFIGTNDGVYYKKDAKGGRIIKILGGMEETKAEQILALGDMEARDDEQLVLRANGRVMCFMVRELISPAVNRPQLLSHHRAHLIAVGKGAVPLLAVATMTHVHLYSYESRKWDLIQTTKTKNKARSLCCLPGGVVFGVKNVHYLMPGGAPEVVRLHESKHSTDTAEAALRVSEKLVLLCYARVGILFNLEQRRVERRVPTFVWEGLVLRIGIFAGFVFCVTPNFVTVFLLTTAQIIETHAVEGHIQYYTSDNNAHHIGATPESLEVSIKRFVRIDTTTAKLERSDDDWLHRLAEKFPAIMDVMPRLQLLREESLGRHRRHSVTCVFPVDDAKMEDDDTLEALRNKLDLKDSLPPLRPARTSRPVRHRRQSLLPSLLS